ncbi:MAG: zinc-binding dehydrogenase [Actinomycetota bacterium]
MKALQMERRELRYVAANVASRLRPGAGADVGPLRMRDLDPPSPPTDAWQVLRPRLAGICGSDLDTVDGHASRYFEPLVSFPFTPGHEVVGDLDDGSRVVLEPVLGHEARGELPPSPHAAPADGHDYGHLVCGHIKPGLQTGSCADTGGGWSEELVAHRTQLHAVSDDMSDEAAVMIEPIACAVHAALRADIQPSDTVAVIGAGTMGLGSVAAVRHLTGAGEILVGAKHGHQRRWATELGASVIVEPDGLRRAARRLTGSRVIGQGLSGGVDVVIDAVGSAASLEDALSIVRPRGRVVLLGLPGHVELDLTGLWHREIELVGAYTYGTETIDGEPRHTFDITAELVRSADLGRLVSATYPLDQYRTAIAHAAQAGSRGSVKVCFDLRDQ